MHWSVPCNDDGAGRDYEDREHQSLAWQVEGRAERPQTGNTNYLLVEVEVEVEVSDNTITRPV